MHVSISRKTSMCMHFYGYAIRYVQMGEELEPEVAPPPPPPPPSPQQRSSTISPFNANNVETIPELATGHTTGWTRVS